MKYAQPWKKVILKAQIFFIATKHALHIGLEQCMG